MRMIDLDKLSKLKTAGELLDSKYGKVGTKSREAFHKRSKLWYSNEIISSHHKDIK